MIMNFSKEKANSYQDVLEYIKENYHIINPRLVGKIDPNRGLTSENIIIADEQENKYFIKIFHRKRDIDQIQDIGDVKQYFASQGVPVIESLRNKHGNKIGYSKGKFFKVRPFINKVELNSLPSDKAVRSMGEVLARIHLAGKGQTHLTSRKIERWDIDKFLKQASTLLYIISEIPHKTEYDHTALEFLQLKIDLASDCKIKFEDLQLSEDTLCHGDFHVQNVFFDHNDNVIYVFDFERAFKGSPFAELARAMLFICFDLNIPELNNISDVNFNRAKSFLGSYYQLNPFSIEDLQKGLQWFYWSMLVCSTWPLEKHYLENSSHADVFVPKRLNRLKYISQNLNNIYNRIKF